MKDPANDVERAFVIDRLKIGFSGESFKWENYYSLEVAHNSVTTHSVLVLARVGWIESLLATYSPQT